MNAQTLKIDRRKIGLAILSGLLLSGSFPNIDLSWLSWFAFVPLLISIRDLSPKDSFRIGLLTGCVHYLTLMYWLAHTMQTYGNLPFFVSIPILFLLATYLGLYVALFSAVTTRHLRTPGKYLIFLPALWVSLEYLRAFIFSGLPWGYISHTQFNNLHLIQISDIFGAYGVSYVIVQTNAVFFMAIQRLKGNLWGRTVGKRHVIGPAIGLVSAFCLIWFYGTWRIDSIDSIIGNAPSQTVSIVQGNIDQALKWDPEFQTATTHKYVALSQKAKEDAPDLVVWPETATPFYFGYHPRLTRLVEQGIRDVGSGFLIGSPSFLREENRVAYYNSAYLIDGKGSVVGKYDKVHLVPFGEYVPFKKWFPFMGKIVAHIGDFTAGKKGKTIQWGKHRIGVQICYEIIFPDLTRHMVKNDAGYIVNITNDAWYGRTSAPYQHFSMTVFRALENRRSIVRSANTGISGFVDPAGRILASTNLFREEIMTVKIPVLAEETLYTRFGDMFAQICLAATLLLVLQGFFTGVLNRRRKSQERRQPWLQN